ncbi:carboxymuconolactone decarboxylase family protein [Asticcacaulis solisilvae]|uniref:carboxymuconolactone decarboxylase family protein n=1 Tax=Asticcacaulis solisilvae TaxID=1217274 RepID=UPI003FD72E62
MTDFPVHTLETAPQAARPALSGLKAAFGFIPNIAGAMSTSPVLVSSLAALFQNVHGGSFSERQIQVLLLTNAVTNASEWPVAFHSYLALQQGLSQADVDAVRDGRLPSEPGLAALSHLARTLIETRGRLAQADIDGFLGAGFSREHLLEVIAVTAASTITNYTGSVTRPPLEAPFDAYAWSRP